jgi:hypothetical protein
LSEVPVTGGKAGLEADGDATAEEITEEMGESSEEAAEDRVKLVTEAMGAVVE